jgi:hypothetical protein
VIANDREYQITLEETKRFEEALAHVEAENAELSPRLRQAVRESLETQLEELRAQLVKYQERTERGHQPNPALARTANETRGAERRA